MDEHWRDLARVVWPDENPATLTVLRQAFYSGATVALARVTRRTDDNKASLYSMAVAIDQLLAEVDRFRSGVG